MESPADNIRTVGVGPDLVLVHGTAADGASGSILARHLCKTMRVTTYDRRCAPCVEDHAADLATVIAHLGAASAYVFGDSFGGAVALELMRTRPELVRGAALFEPAVAADDRAATPSPLLVELDELVAAQKGPEAAERFHRRVLSDATWNRLPPAAKERARGLWRQIHADLLAQAAHRVRYAELAAIDVPVLLLSGGRSRQVFEPALAALAAALPRARRAVLEQAVHRISGRAWQELAAALREFIASV